MHSAPRPASGCSRRLWPFAPAYRSACCATPSSRSRLSPRSTWPLSRSCTPPSRASRWARPHADQTASRRPSITSRLPGPSTEERITVDSLPICDYALLSDCRSAALVSREGSVDWLCCPRFDGRSVFCRLVDAAGGHFAVHPTGNFQVERRYVDDTMVLETTFTTAHGTAVLTDAMALGRGERGHDLGARSPGVLLRRLACTTGEIDAEVHYAPRPEYGLVHPILVPIDGGVAVRGGADRLLLSTPARFDIDGGSATARVRLAAGQ